MTDQIIENKTDNDQLSSRMESQASSSRPIHLGWAPVYISPKIIQEESSYNTKTKIFSDNKINFKPEKKINFKIVGEDSSHEIIKTTKKKMSQKIQSSQLNFSEQKNITFIKFNHLGLNIMESLIFCTFLMGSFNILGQFIIIDYVGNIICLLKILLYHLLIFIYNSRIKFDESEQKQDKKQKQKKILYINRLQMYQLIQIWSISCTICLIIALHNPIIYGIINSIRLVRLFFIFFLERKKQNSWKPKVFLHIFKITIAILIFCVLLAIALQLLLYNIQNYYCMQSMDLVTINVGYFQQKQFQKCGISKSCQLPQNCRNIFSFTENQMHKKMIQQSMHIQSASFSKNLLISILSVLSIPGSYHLYKMYLMQWVLLPLIAIIWLILLTFTGIGIGQAISFQSIQNWKSSRCIQTREKQQNMRKKSKNKKKKKRISNISFNSEVNQKLNNLQQTQNPQFSKQVAFIEQELKNRSLMQKITTVIFNLASLTQVLFVIVQNLNIDPWVNTVSGICLGIIFIIWTCGLGFAIYQKLCNLSNPQSEQKSTNIYETYVLLYQIGTYCLTLFDYILRIIFHQYLFESSTQLTPFSQAAISLRIIYIIFNNGFDAHISYLIEKMIQNFINTKSVIGVMIIIGVSIGFILSYNLQYFRTTDQIQLISMTISMIYGVNGNIPPKNFLLSVISFILCFIGIIVNFYLAKHINMGYDSILNIDFSQQSMQLPKKNYKQQNKQSNQNVIRKNVKNILSYHYYYKTKALLVIIYVILTLIFQHPSLNSTVQIIKFTIDIFLIIDLIGQFVGYGISGQQSYLWEDCIPKCLYIASQIFLFICYFLPNIERSFVNSLRVSRGFILFGCIPQLNNIYILIKTIIFHHKIKIYKIILLSIPLMIIGMCLSSAYVGLQTQNNDLSNKLLNLFAFSASFIYNFGWAFVSKKNPLNFSYLCLNFIFVSVILFLHVILTFMIVTFFVNRKVKAQGDQGQELLRQYQTTQPQFYHFDTTNDRNLYKYLKAIKIIIIFVSIVLLGMLSGGWLQYSEKRTFVAVANLFLCFVQIIIYAMENLFIKQGIQRWSIPQICLLGLSLPGSFFVAFPPIKFSNNIQVNIIVRVFLFLSVFRLFRLFCLLKNRSIKQFSSKILRRITKQLYFGQTLGIFLFVVISILPFSTFQANISNSECPQQFINFLSGSIFPNKNIRLVQLIPKIICTWFILFPIRTMLLARIISSLLSNKPNQLLFLRDQIGNIISQSQILQKISQNLQSKQTFYIPFNRIYKFSAQVDRIFRQFTLNNKVKCLGYEQIMKKIDRMNIPLYKFTYNCKDQYGLLIYDIIWNILQEYKKQIGQQTQQLKSLFQQAKHKKQNIRKTHFGTHQLLAYLKIQRNIYKKIKQSRINMKIKCQNQKSS